VLNTILTQLNQTIALPMNSITLPESATRSKFNNWVVLFLRTLQGIEVGQIEVTTPEGEKMKFKGSRAGVSVKLKIYDWRFCERIFLKSDIGLGESYIRKEWHSDNVNGLIQLAVANEKILGRIVLGSALSILYYRVKHMLNRNTKKGSKRNILAHYDLGNEFYKLWLDESMTYSSALFGDADIDLKDAQARKYQHIIDQLEAKPGDHILELGCGWGGFAEYAAQQGYRVTGITISEEQHEYARVRLQRFGSSVDIQLKDYREVSGKFDHVVSIEMFEALGQSYWPTYFSVINKVLKPTGNAIIQSITIRNESFASYARGTDFIQQYIFPGGMLPSPKKFVQVAQKQGLKLTATTDFGLDYAKTLAAWELSFTQVEQKVRDLGFDDSFIRMWRFYLKYCQGGFEAEKLGVSQFRLAR
jgi:cyclopropane-fatty-acyl-phospholipid synthase